VWILLRCLACCFWWEQKRKNEEAQLTIVQREEKIDIYKERDHLKH
jgi:hypothetical protein